MEARMSLRARRELLNSIRPRYRRADREEKKRILDEFVQVTRYGRKHAIALLNREEEQTREPRGTGRKRKYDQAVKQALVQVWRLANEICSKRLIPFLPDFVEALERTGQLEFSSEVRQKLLTMCPATADQLLASERQCLRGKTTTRPGALLKRQIPIRTFAEWNDVVPGFFEADLVAHCGGTTRGRYVQTLVLTDIATSWTEFFAIPQKGENEVIAALKAAQEILPVAIQGFDSDNGSEFINLALIDFCRENGITFTRARPYKKNDQAHVEERNGSVVRRTVGYDRFEGVEAMNALQQLYEIMRLYVNFFQPTMKLITKHRDGAKVYRRYDSAQTPYRRMLTSQFVPEEAKDTLRRLYAQLNPVALLRELEQRQDALWKYSWKYTDSAAAALDMRITIFPSAGAENSESCNGKISLRRPAFKATNQQQRTKRTYRKSGKPRKPRIGRTRKDPFENVNEEIRKQFQRNPNITAKQLLIILQKESPGNFSDAQRRTLMRRLQQLRSSGHETIPAPTRTTYPKHPKRRRQLTTEQWQRVTEEIKACFKQNQNLSVQELLKILQTKFPESMSDAQIPTLRRRVKELRNSRSLATEQIFS